jgi:hypothetical protein
VVCLAEANYKEVSPVEALGAGIGAVLIAAAVVVGVVLLALYLVSGDSLEI